MDSSLHLRPDTIEPHEVSQFINAQAARDATKNAVQEEADSILAQVTQSRAAALAPASLPNQEVPVNDGRSTSAGASSEPARAVMC